MSSYPAENTSADLAYEASKLQAGLKVFFTTGRQGARSIGSNAAKSRSC